MPDNIQSAADASRHVGAVKLTPNPTAAANVTRIRESAVAACARAMTGVHCKYLGSAPSGPVTSVSNVMALDLTGQRRRTGQPGCPRPDQRDKSNRSLNPPP